MASLDTATLPMHREAEVSRTANQQQPMKGLLSVKDVEQQRQIRGASWAVLILSLLSSMFLYALDNTILANIRPNIIDTLGHVELLTCVSVFYTLALASVAPLWGALSGVFDRKKLYIAAFVLFEIGSAINGAAKSMLVLVIGRFVAGIGGAGVYVCVTNIISALATPDERPQYLGFIGIAWSSGILLGPIIGGAFAGSSATWRWAFYINLCVAAVNLPIYIFLLPPLHNRSRQPIWSRIKSIDFAGAVLYFGATIAVILALSFGGSVYMWDSPQMIALYVLSGVLWPLFGIQQSTGWFATQRLLPVHFIREWTMVSLFIWTAIAMASLIVPIYTLPLLFQFGFGFSSMKAAKYTLPFLAPGIVTLAISSKIYPKYPTYKWWYIVAAVLLLVSSAIMSSFTIDTTVGTICGVSVISGIGSGLIVQLGHIVAQTKKPRDQQSEITAFLTCAQIGGSVLAIAVSTCIFVNRATTDIAVILPDIPRAAAQAVLAGVGRDGLIELSSAPELLRQILSVIVENCAHLFYLNVGGAALGLLVAIAMPRERAQGSDQLAEHDNYRTKNGLDDSPSGTGTLTTLK